ncbi:hypothetical protein [Caldimonas brevitalea]|uniref:Uncharacterized protein n=1 Tax=Caldimonas brevitalea TaxID=413882 RepID=A0A0G3BNB9_9BURK|nr:hypothetical protein [Caldimonas brevitalea]AKJ30897.1 hypothetical protein AAW51_4206 [Caldimonas brevitalea]
MSNNEKIASELEDVTRAARELGSLLATLGLLCSQIVGLAGRGAEALAADPAEGPAAGAQSLLPLARAAHTLAAVGWGRASVCGDRIDALAADAPLKDSAPPEVQQLVVSKLRQAGADARATCSTLEMAGQALERAIDLLEGRANGDPAAWQASREIFEGVMARLGSRPRSGPGPL